MRSRRLDLLLRPVVRAHARLRHRARAGAGLPGRLPDPARRRPDDVQLVVDRTTSRMPNGLCFSPDESLLYINDTPRAHIRVFDVDADGTFSNGRVFSEGIGIGRDRGGDPVDGMKLDERGNIWVTGPGGVWVISARGRAPRHDQGPGERRQPELGRRRLAHRCSSRARRRCTAIRTKVGPRQPSSLHALGGATMDPTRPASAAAHVIQDLQNDVIIEGGAFADSGAPGARDEPERRRERQGPRRRRRAGRRAGDPRLVHRRAGRAGPEAERAAVPGRQGRERARPRHAGAPPRRTASSHRTATTSSRRCG